MARCCDNREETDNPESLGSMELADECNCKTTRTKIRDEKEFKDLINRLNRIEGQIRGIKNMVENSAYCPDILTQVAACRSALGSFSKVLLGNHIKSCVKTDIKEGNDEAVDELVELLQKMMK